MSAKNNPAKPLEGILAVYFDLGWTLEAPANGDWLVTRRFIELCNPCGFASVSGKRLQDAVDHAGRYLAANHKLETMKQEETQFTHFYSLIAKELPCLGLTDEKAADIAYDRTYNIENYQLLSDTKQTLEELRKRNIKLGVISDTWPSVVLQLTQLGITSYFDTFTFSYELGVFKPDPAIYRDARTKMGIVACKTAFVDDMVKNLDGAQKLGIIPVQSLAEPGKVAGIRYPTIRKPSDIFNLM